MIDRVVPLGILPWSFPTTVMYIIPPTRQYTAATHHPKSTAYRMFQKPQVDTERKKPLNDKHVDGYNYAEI